MFVWLALTVPALAGDKDKDGIANKVDQCLDQKEDVDSFEDEDGCPDPDNDGDGVEDDDDRCLNDPEDHDEHEDTDGCPDTDDDDDGVLDADDKCPDEKESGEDKDGCPAVDLTLMTSTGLLANLGELTAVLVDAAGKSEAGCDLAATKAKLWVSENDANKQLLQWNARLSRAPEDFDGKAANDLLGGKNDIYRKVKPALDIFCKDNAAWQGVAASVDAVFALLPEPPPPPAPVKKKR